MPRGGVRRETEREKEREREREREREKRRVKDREREGTAGSSSKKVERSGWRRESEIRIPCMVGGAYIGQ